MKGSGKPDRTLEKFFQLLPRNVIKPQILYIGYGNSADFVALRRHGHKVHRIKFLPDICMRGRTEDISTLQGEYEHFPFNSGPFHGIWTNDSLTKVSKRRIPTVLRRIHSLLCQGGILFLRLAEDGNKEAQNISEAPITSASWTYGEINMILERCNLSVHEILHRNDKEPVLEIFAEKR